MRDALIVPVAVQEWRGCCVGKEPPGHEQVSARQYSYLRGQGADCSEYC